MTLVFWCLVESSLKYTTLEHYLYLIEVAVVVVVVVVIIIIIIIIIICSKMFCYLN